MRHLLISREYPPAPGGGIGTYVHRIATLLADAGETVHVIAPAWTDAPVGTQSSHDGRLVVHRLPFLDPRRWPRWAPHPDLPDVARRLFELTPCPTEVFGWQASMKAEELVESERIDIVEAQEYEAPLYHFMARRAAGLGPSSRPPVLIHLHTPTEFLAEHDDEDPLAPFHLRNSRYESFCIGAADALLCPSRFLARRAEARYGLAPEAVRVIRLPMGSLQPVERSPEVWRDGTILYIGRLQALKGVFEWARAATVLAREFPEARFRFLGDDVPWSARRDRTVGEIVRSHLPESVRGNFEFPGAVPREQVREELAGARIGVVPSRWENFPNACVEMMASGLPVVATVCGGMAEMAEDGLTGWIANQCEPEALAAVARRALSTSPDKLASMGARAAEEIARRCEDARVLEAHLEFRARIVDEGVSCSIRVPGGLSRGRGAPPLVPDPTVKSGIGVVVPCFNLGCFLPECLASLEAQTVPPARVVIVDDGSTEAETLEALDHARQQGYEVVTQDNQGVVATRCAGARHLRETGERPGAYVFLDADDRLRPGFVERALCVLESSPTVGIVSCWTWHFGEADRLWACPCPSFPYQWVTNEAATFSAIRAEAYDGVGGFRDIGMWGYEDWDLVNAILADGWIAFTVPEILAEYRVRGDSGLRSLTAHAHGFMRRKILERFPDLVRRDAMEIVRLNDAQDAWTMREELFELRSRMARVRRMGRRPHEAVGWAFKKLWCKMGGRRG